MSPNTPASRPLASVPSSFGPSALTAGSPGDASAGTGRPQYSESIRRSGTFPSISLPTGGSSIGGMGEKFNVNAANGTASMAVPIPTSAGRDGFGPKLSLQYDSGAGNGPFGLGWNLPLPAISRKTSKGIPQYRDEAESDVFLLGGAEDLVPLFQKSKTGEIVTDKATGAPIRHSESRDGFLIHRYAPRVEGAYSRIERWTKLQGQEYGDMHWRVLSSENVTSVYGRDQNSRIACPDGGQPGQQVFSWLLSESWDCKGNAIIYKYKQEDSESVDTGAAHEQRRTDESRTCNRYLKTIQYGNRTPNRDPDWKAFSPLELASDTWMFSVVFDYGEMDMQRPSPQEEGSPWLCRKDPFSKYTSAFEIRTYRLCQNIVMFHHFPEELGQPDTPVSSWRLTYEEHAHLTYLMSVVYTGYISDRGKLTSKTLPPVTFEYSRSPTDEALSEAEVLEADPTDLQSMLSGGGSVSSFQWLDLDGEGLPGVLLSCGNSWLYHRNLGGVPTTSGDEKEAAGNVAPSFGPVETVWSIPSLLLKSNGGIHLTDVQGDGMLDLVCMSEPAPGFFERKLGGAANAGWMDYRHFESFPSLMGDPLLLRFIDLTGDGRPDIVMSDHQAAFVWYPSLGERGYGPVAGPPPPLSDETIPGLLFRDTEQSMHLADMSGDGLTDLVRIRNGDVCYWPNLGYGRFGPMVTLDNSPWFDTPAQFDPQRLLLADIDGSGTTDLIYTGLGGTFLCLNQAGNSFSDPKRLSIPPLIDKTSTLELVDLLGNGSACLVWLSRAPGVSKSSLKYVDFNRGSRPHLLVRESNNRGTETHIYYAPSTKFYLEDKAQNREWVTRLPFPVHCVEKVETWDRISNTRLVARYAYHHGYYDGHEREFRGFAMVDQWDTEEFDSALPESAWHVPAAHVRSWFHTGSFLDAGADTLAKEYFSQGGYGGPLLGQSQIPTGLENITCTREAYRALKGSMLRQESYADDGTGKSHIPYTVSEMNYTVELRQTQDQHGHSVCAVYPTETILATFERDHTDPRIQHSIILDVGPFGNVLKQLSIAYGREGGSPLGGGLAAQVQNRTLISYHESDYTNKIDENDDYRLPQKHETRSYEIMGLDVSASSRYKLTTSNKTEMEIAALADIPYESLDIAKGKRLIHKSRAYFRSNDLARDLDLGVMESMAIEGPTNTLAFTPGLLSIYQRHKNDDKSTTQKNLLSTPPSEMLGSVGQYVDLDGDGCWWSQSSAMFFNAVKAAAAEAEIAEARTNFFQPQRLVDQFGNTSVVAYDGNRVAVIQTTDAVGNKMQSQLDYRTLQPRLVTDANGNRTASAFDEFGRLAAVAVMGKEGQKEGDSLDGFTLGTREQVDDFLRDPQGAAAEALLGTATKRIIYDISRFSAEPDSAQKKPIFHSTLLRETHASDTDSANRRIQVQFSYCDGSGRVVQKKTRARATDKMKTAWKTSGWIVFNNKGLPVRQYEPFYDKDHEYVASTETGVTPIMVYDPLGRLIATINADHSWKKVVFAPWHFAMYDENDTALLDPKTDVDIGSAIQFLPDEDYLPTWHEQRRTGQLGRAEQAAAVKAGQHASTPLESHLDPNGQVSLAIEDNGNGERYQTMALHDIQGHQRRVVDSKGRLVMEFDYDMTGSVIHQRSMESGERWMLHDTNGAIIFSWDSRMHRFGSVYDAMRRRIRATLQLGPSERELVIERTVYGESLPDAEATNSRGRVVQIFDQAGVADHAEYDFKGNLLLSERRFARQYKSALDWGGDVAVDKQVFVSTSTFDALNRLVEQGLPDGSTTRAAYDEAGDLCALHARVRGEEIWTPFIRDIRYNARAQKTHVYHGNGAFTSFKYDPSTFMVAEAATRRPSEAFPAAAADDPPQSATDWPGSYLQRLHYTYDAAKNVVSITDTSQQTIFFRNKRVDPTAEYTYDALYRLIQATGREHVGTTFKPGRAGGWAPTEHPSDGAALSRYVESYTYDSVGNLQAMKHQGDREQQAWTRKYTYEEPSLLEPEQHYCSNRLSRTTVGQMDETYAYDEHGNMKAMPGLPSMRWDYGDRLQATTRQRQRQADAASGDDQAAGGGGTPETTWYVYDSSGTRVRKVTERQSLAGEAPPTRLKERLYVGAIEVFRRFDSQGEETTLERETLAVRALGGETVALVETTVKATTKKKKKKGIPARLVRYQACNHLQSVSLELDEQARIVTYEEYSPYGATTYSAAWSAVEVPRKRYGYTGKERDSENGLYYYGGRYYCVVIARWTSCDPSGLVDGPDVYVYVRCNPVNRVDPDGRMGLNKGTNEGKGGQGQGGQPGKKEANPFKFTAQDPAEWSHRLPSMCGPPPPPFRTHAPFLFLNALLVYC